MKSGNQSSKCPLWPDSPERCRVILDLKWAFSSMSLIGCIFVIALIWLFRKYQNCVQRLMLCLTISACMQSISYMIGDFHTANPGCAFQAFLIQYFNWSTILWVGSISINIILIIRDASSPKYEKWYHIISWSIPLLFAIIPFGGHKYGRSGFWCWIRYGETALRFGTWYVPKFIIIIFLVAAYVYIILTVLRQKHQWSGTYNADNEREKDMLAQEVKPLIAFPLIYVLLSVPSIIYRIDDAMHPLVRPSYALSILMVIASPSVGAVNALAFALYSGIHNYMSWNQIKFHFYSHFRDSGGVTHNVEIDDQPIVDTLQMKDEWGSTITM